MRTLKWLSVCVCVTSAFADSTEWVAFREPKPRGPDIGQPRYVERRFALLVYFGTPDRPYELLGQIYVHESEPAGTREQILRGVVAAARNHGADAVLVAPITEVAQAAMARDGVVFYAIAVKWKR